LKRFITIALAVFLASCQTLQPVIDNLQSQEADCKAAGGAFVLGKGCVMPDPTPTEPPAPEPGPPPSPGPAPAPPGSPAPHGPDVVYGPFNDGQFYQFPPVDRLERFVITFALQGLDGATFPTRDGWIAAIVGRTATGQEYTLQVHIFLDGRSAQVRLITQNFQPGLCGARHCDVNDGILDMILDPAARYDVKIYGPVPHTTRGFPVWRMEWTAAGQPVGTWEVPAFGAFDRIDYIRVGNGGIFPGRPGQAATLTVINPTLKIGE